MTDRSPEVSPAQLPVGTDSAARGLVAVPWSTGSALSLVVVAFILTLLAGVLSVAIGSARWNPVVHALGVGGVVLGVYGVMLVVVWATSATMGVRFAEAVGLKKAAGPRWYLLAVACAAGGWLFSAAFTTMLTAWGFELPREDLALFRLMPSGPLGVSIMVALLIVAAPFAEEVVYRGVLLPALGAHGGAGTSIAVSAAVFSAVHLSAAGFVPLLVVGALLGWLFVASRSLKVAILAHAVFNALGVAVLLTSKTQGIL